MRDVNLIHVHRNKRRGNQKSPFFSQNVKGYEPFI